MKTKESSFFTGAPNNHHRTEIINSSSKILAVLLAAVPLAAISQEATLGTVVVTAPKDTDSPAGASKSNKEGLASQRTATSDSARLLQDIPGVSLYGAGGVSSLPAIHGLADDRVRVQVDGMDLVAACPNHMNSALSYIDPTQVGSATVFAGITPVSVGGDSIGGTIQVKSAAPEFADGEEDDPDQRTGRRFLSQQWQCVWRQCCGDDRNAESERVL